MKKALAGSFLIAAALAGCGSSSAETSSQTGMQPAPAPPSARKINIDLREMAISEDSPMVARGEQTLVIHNSGKLKHELIVLKTDKAPQELAKPGSKRALETGKVAEVPSIKPGQTVKLKINFESGRYVLICNIPGHYAAGMRNSLDAR